jgi:hypothetical protein
MEKPLEKTGRFDSWFAAAVGGAAIVLGVAILWVQIAGDSEHEARKSWTHARGRLNEVSISYSTDVQYGSRYSLEARYSFLAGGEEFEGTWIDGSTVSDDVNDAKRLAARFVPEAVNLTKDDLSFLQNRKTWLIPFPGADVLVKYDPANPRRAVLILDQMPSMKVVGHYVIWSIGLGFIILGLLAFAVFVSDISRKHE